VDRARSREIVGSVEGGLVGAVVGGWVSRRSRQAPCQQQRLYDREGAARPTGHSDAPGVGCIPVRTRLAHTLQVGERPRVGAEGGLLLSDCRSLALTQQAQQGPDRARLPAGVAVPPRQRILAPRPVSTAVHMHHTRSSNR
jgi:hypothetical protein